MRRLYCVVLVSAFYISFSTTSSLCYSPDGTQIEGDSPCSLTSVSNSTCCGPGYACLSNNFCAWTSHVGRGNDQAKYGRGTCTDKTWSSAFCPKICLKPDHGDNMAGGVGITKCPNAERRFHCMNQVLVDVGEDNMCSNSSNYWELADTPTTVTIIGVTSSVLPTATAMITAPSSAISASTTPSSTPSKNTNNIAIGAGVGVPLGVIAISVAVFLFYGHRRHQRLVPTTESQLNELVPPATTQKYKAVPEDGVY